MNGRSSAIKVLHKRARGGGLIFRPPTPDPQPPTPFFKIAILSLFFPLTLMSQIPYLPGWPQAVLAPTGRPIYIADINNDGENELITMVIGNNFQDAMLYAFNMDGTIMSGFPISSGKNFNGDPGLFDSNDDGTLELAVSQGGNMHLRDQQGIAIWSIPYDGPIFQSYYYPFRISVDDLDNDGNREIVVTCYNGGAVFIFDAQGNVRPGWPVIIPKGCPTCGPPQIQVSASIGDIDHDGIREIIVPLAGTHAIYCFKPDGTICPGFPVDTINVNNGQATLADIDGDQYLEIILVNSEYFIILRYNGIFYPGFPIWGYASGSEPSITFSTGECLIAFAAGVYLYSENYLYRINPVEILPGWPANVTGWHFINTPLFADISDTSSMEIITGAYSNAIVSDGRMYAYDMYANVVPGFPTPNLYHRGIKKTGAVNDLNGDGILDFCFGSANNEAGTPKTSTVYCWTTGHAYNLDNVDWAMDGFDLGHTGRWRRLYHIDKMNSTLDVAGCAAGRGASSNIPLYKRGNEGDFERQMRESPILPNPSDSLFQRERGSEPKKVPATLMNPGRITSTARLSPCYLPPDGSLIPVTVTAVRQTGGQAVSGQDVRYSRTLGCANYEGPVIDNGDGTYARMLRAPTAECTTDVHAWVNEFKLQDYQTIVFRIPNPKEASPAATPVTAEKGAGTSVMVHYTAGCGATTHAVYWGSGPIISALNWTDVACNVASGGTFDPGELNSGEWIYFVVVGQNSTLEGSYGNDSLDQERPEAVAIGPCDKPQDLTGTCP